MELNDFKKAIQEKLDFNIDFLEFSNSKDKIHFVDSQGKESIYQSRLEDLEADDVNNFVRTIDFYYNPNRP